MLSFSSSLISHLHSLASTASSSYRLLGSLSLPNPVINISLNPTKSFQKNFDDF